MDGVAQIEQILKTEQTPSTNEDVRYGWKLRKAELFRVSVFELNIFSLMIRTDWTFPERFLNFSLWSWVIISWLLQNESQQVV